MPGAKYSSGGIYVRNHLSEDGKKVVAGCKRFGGWLVRDLPVGENAVGPDKADQLNCADCIEERNHHGVD